MRGEASPSLAIHSRTTAARSSACQLALCLTLLIGIQPAHADFYEYHAPHRISRRALVHTWLGWSVGIEPSSRRPALCLTRPRPPSLATAAVSMHLPVQRPISRTKGVPQSHTRSTGVPDLVTGPGEFRLPVRGWWLRQATSPACKTKVEQRVSGRTVGPRALCKYKRCSSWLLIPLGLVFSHSTLAQFWSRAEVGGFSVEDPRGAGSAGHHRAACAKDWTSHPLLRLSQRQAPPQPSIGFLAEANFC